MYVNYIENVLYSGCGWMEWGLLCDNEELFQFAMHVGIFGSNEIHCRF